MKAKWFIALFTFGLVAALTAGTRLDPMSPGLFAQENAAPAAQGGQGGRGGAAPGVPGVAGGARGRGAAPVIAGPPPGVTPLPIGLRTPTRMSSNGCFQWRAQPATRASITTAVATRRTATASVSSAMRVPHEH